MIKNFALCSMFLFIACGSIPPTNYYTLNFSRHQENNGKVKKTYPHVIGVDKLESALLLDDDRIIYRESEYQVKFWNYQRWIARPNIMVTESLIEYLKTKKMFDDVVKLPSRTRVNYMLGGKLLSFEEWDEDGKWFGKVAFEINLKDVAADKIVWRSRYEKMLPVEQQLPSALVATISEAMYNCLKNLGDDIEKEFDTISRN